MSSRTSRTGVTVERIAREAGLSNATVSRVLNNTQYVSPEAREAVMAIVRKSGEPPTLLGRRVKPKSASGYVEVLMVKRFETEAAARSATPRMPRVTRLIENVVGELGVFGYRGVFEIASDLSDPALLKPINDPNCRGLLLGGNYGDDVLPFIDRCRVPVVSLMSWPFAGWPDYVGIDNVLGIQLGFDHVRELGHKRIGYIAGQLEHTYVFHQRLAAYKMAMLAADLPWKRDWISEGSCETETMLPEIVRMLRRADRPTAILCAFDAAAIAVRRAADEVGLRIPQDLSVVGFDDDVIAQLFSPPLTTVRLPNELIARSAVQLLAMRQQHPIQPGEGVTMRLTPTLTVRSSTAAPPK